MKAESVSAAPRGSAGQLLQPIGECAADFTTFDTLESVKEWLSSLPPDEQDTLQALQRLRAAEKACTASSGMRSEVQKLCQDWGIPQKANQKKRKMADVMADMKAKVLEDASKLVRERSTGVIDLTSGPPAKRQRLLLERGLFGRDSALDPGAAVPTNADSWGRRAHAR